MRPIRNERDTKTMEMTSISADIAFTSGVTPMRIIPKMYTGSVVAPAPATK